jgi:hypothetical protein
MNQFQIGDRVQIQNDRVGTVVKKIDCPNGKSYIIDIDKEGTTLYGDTVKISPVSITDSADLS